MDIFSLFEARVIYLKGVLSNFVVEISRLNVFKINGGLKMKIFYFKQFDGQFNPMDTSDELCINIMVVKHRYFILTNL